MVHSKIYPKTYNKIDEKKTYHYDCFVVSNIHFLMPEAQQSIFVNYFDYLISLRFKGSCGTLGIYFR